MQKRAATAVVILWVIQVDDALPFHVGLTGQDDDPNRFVTVLRCPVGSRKATSNCQRGEFAA